MRLALKTGFFLLKLQEYSEDLETNPDVTPSTLDLVCVAPIALYLLCVLYLY